MKKATKNAFVRSERIFTPQKYIDAVTGHCFYFQQEDTIAEIQDKLDRYCVDTLWNYPLGEIDHIVENNLSVVLVDVSGFYGGEVIIPQYRWYEVPEDFIDDDTKDDDAEETPENKSASSNEEINK